jgi:hypothetical protein
VPVTLPRPDQVASLALPLGSRRADLRFVGIAGDLAGVIVDTGPEIGGATHRRRNARSALPFRGGRPGSMTSD